MLVYCARDGKVPAGRQESGLFSAEGKDLALPCVETNKKRAIELFGLC